MTLSEFDLIQRFFSDCGTARGDVLVGVGDDAALLRVPAGMDLAVTLDAMVEGVHFLPDTDPTSLGHKVLAVNLSDLAAMGADPAWITLSLTLPASDPSWLASFSDGFCALARRAGVRLVGGDTTRGPLTISVAAKGLVPAGRALHRAGARGGDLIFVTGSLGDAGLGLRTRLDGVDVEDPDYLLHRLERPEPRLAVGRALRGLATAAIDISDGLAADLGHVMSASGVGAIVELGRLPCSKSVAAFLTRTGDWSLPLSSGDDYELCFTVPPGKLAGLDRLEPRPHLPADQLSQSPAGLRAVGLGLSHLRPRRPPDHRPGAEAGRRLTGLRFRADRVGFQEWLHYCFVCGLTIRHVALASFLAAGGRVLLAAPAYGVRKQLLRSSPGALWTREVVQHHEGIRVHRAGRRLP